MAGKVSASVIAFGLASILLASSILAVLFTLPSTWLLMLFLGNIGVNVGFWGALPGGLLIGTLASRVTVNKE